MCFSFDASFGSWVFVLTFSFATLYLSTFLNHKNRKLYIYLTSLLLTFTNVQILEAMLWVSKEIHKPFLTQLIYIALWHQPIVNAWGLALFWGGASRVIVFVICFIHAVIISTMGYSFIGITLFQEFRCLTTPGGLVWDREYSRFFLGISNDYSDIIPSLIYFFGMILPTSLTLTAEGIIFTIFGISTYLISAAVRGSKLSSFWCFIATSYALVLFLCSVVNLWIQEYKKSIND